MDANETEQETTGEVNLEWAKTESTFNLDDLKPQEHGNFTQRGDYLFCGIEGHNHSAKLPPGKVLNQRNGKWVLDDITIKE